MAEERGFLDRWSKRKRAARDAEALPEVAPEPRPDPAPLAAATTNDDGADEPEIDPAELPPLDSITSSKDVQAFLRKGVPKTLRQAALRRLWSADPAIREFREVADYDWDFNAPGYGALSPADDPKAAAEKLFAAIRRQVTAKDRPEPTEPAPRHTAASPAMPPAAAEAEALPAEAAPAAPAPEPFVAPAAPARRRRRHGSAMPS